MLNLYLSLRTVLFNFQVLEAFPVFFLLVIYSWSPFRVGGYILYDFNFEQICKGWFYDPWQILEKYVFCSCCLEYSVLCQTLRNECIIWCFCLLLTSYLLILSITRSGLLRSPTILGHSSLVSLVSLGHFTLCIWHLFYLAHAH